MPCSETSRPAISTSGSPRIPTVAFISHSAAKEAVNVKAPTATRPRACVPSWSNEPVYQRPPVPVARFSASAGTAKMPVASVPQTPAIPCTATAPIGSSIRARSTARTPTTAIAPATKPIRIAAQGATKPHAAVTATSAATTPFSVIERSGFLITSQETITPPSPPAAAELADPRPQQQRPRERGERALVVHDRRAREVLHPLGEEPAVWVPDPVRDDGVDQREDDPEREIDPEPRPLGHRAPDDRKRNRCEDDLEQVCPGCGDGAEPAERLRSDREQGVGAREEAAAA